MEAADAHQAEKEKGNLTAFIQLESFSLSFFLKYNLTYMYTISVSIAENPDDLKEVFNLDCLADFDIQKLPDIEDYGDKILGEIQATMEEMYGDSMAAALPEDRIQSCLMGVKYTYFLLFYAICFNCSNNQSYTD